MPIPWQINILIWDKLELYKLAPGALIYTDGSSYKIGDPLRDWKMLIPTIMADIGSIRDKLKIFKIKPTIKDKEPRRDLPIT